MKILCEKCGQPVRDKVDIRHAKAVLCSNCVQAHVGFINMLESVCKRKITNKMSFKDVYYEWCHIGKPKNFSLRGSERLKRLKKGVITAQKYPVLDRSKYPVSWQDLL